MNFRNLCRSLCRSRRLTVPSDLAGSEWGLVVNVPMRTLKRILLIGCLLGAAAPLGQAFNYTDADLVLVFRQDGFNDVEFDLGPASTFLQMATGTHQTVSFDLNLVQNNFNNSLDNVTFLVAGATGVTSTQPRIWLTDVYASPAPTDFTLSKFTAIRGKIMAIGQQASLLTASNSLPAVIATAEPGSFTYIASDANFTPASSLGGLTGFPIEGLIPAALNFYELQLSTVTPKPAAALIGTFNLDASGNLTFNAGGAPTLTAPSLSGIVRSGNVVTISFASVAGQKYHLRYATALPGTFTAVGSPVTGDGNVQTLTDTSSDASRFYDVQTTQ